MLEARILSPCGSLYYAGEAHPRDLEMLQHHLQDAGTARGRDHVALEVVVHDTSIDPGVATWVRRIGRTGIRVQLLLAPDRSTSATAPDAPAVRVAS